ncbi:MAG: MFS transporter [Bryobacteraceae bacterium]|nr:MFS transporter [Bryobacteraceae bacterium]
MNAVLSKRSLVILVALLLGSTTINYIDRQVLSVLAPVLRDEFRLTNSQYAAILNAFMITYAVALPAAGWVIDRLGVGRGLSLAVTWWSIAGMLTALSRGPVSMGVFRSLLAMGEGGAWPSFAKAVSIWVPAAYRTLAIGVCNSGSSLGAMIAPPLVVFITHHSGWRGAFVITGAMGLAWVLVFQIFRFLHPAMRATEKGQTDGLPATPRLKWLALIRYRQAWAIFVCRFFADPIWYFYIFWIPEFLTRERGLNLTAIAAVAWIPFLVSDISNFTTGLIALRLERAGWSVNRTRKALMLAGALVSPIGVAAAYSTSLFWTMTFICVAIFFWMAWSVTVQTLVTDYFPAHAVASVYGFGGTGSTVGSVISTWLVGRTLDLTHSYTPVLAALGLLMPMAFLIGTRLMGAVKQVDLRAAEAPIPPAAGAS